MTEEGHFSHAHPLYMRFLLHSDAYEFENREKQERIFSSFAEWFREDCARRYQRESSTDGDSIPYVIGGHDPKPVRVTREGEDTAQHDCLGCHTFRSLQQLLIMYGWLAGQHLCQISIALYTFPDDNEDDIEFKDVSQQGWSGHTEMLAIVPVEAYKLYNISIPKNTKAAAEAEYQLQLTNLPDDCLPNLDLAYICDWAYNDSGQVNRRLRPNGEVANTTQPPLLIFNTCLRLSSESASIVYLPLVNIPWSGACFLILGIVCLEHPRWIGLTILEGC